MGKKKKPKRALNDAYYTKPATANIIVASIQALISAPRLILEPSVGKGAFAQALRRTYPESYITAVDVDITHYDKYRDHIDEFHWRDWCKFEPQCKQDLILGNPPYSTAEEHVTHARARLRIGGHAAFLLRLAFLSSQGRAERVFSKPGFKYLIPFGGRPNFDYTYEDGTPSGSGTDQYDYAVFVWQKGYTGKPPVEPHYVGKVK